MNDKQDRFEQIKRQYRRWPGDTEYNGGWGNDIAWLIDEVQRLTENDDGQENALSLAKTQLEAAGRDIDDLRAALTEAHQHAEVLQDKLDELTKESET